MGASVAAEQNASVTEDAEAAEPPTLPRECQTERPRWRAVWRFLK